ncbi:MAG: M48 family metalloprotease [Planctomycetota bacterium]
MVRVWMVVMVLAASALGLGGCSRNPATGELIFTMMTWEQEKAIGLEAGPQFTDEYGGEVPDAEARAYVDEVGRRLLEGIEEGVPELEWNFTLLDSQVINAFALPGGQVYFSRGLAEKLDSEAAMAGVIGHEIGHVTARHGNQRISRTQAFQAVLAAGAVAVGVADEDSALRRYGTIAVPAIAVAGQPVQLKYGRDEELEADYLGMRYMARAGYNPVGQRRVMEVLGAASRGRSQPEWLSTHPASETRIDRIDDLLAGEFAFTQNTREFIINEDAYQRRMLARLDRLGPPAHGSQSVSLLENPALWCGHCAVVASSEKNLDQLLNAMSAMSASL